MDVTSPFPASWSLVRKNLPGLLGAGVGALAGSFVAARKAYRQAQVVSRPIRKMPVRMARPLRAARRRFSRRRYVPRNKGMSLGYRRIVRSTASSSLAITGPAQRNVVNVNSLLNTIETTDLQGIYSLFRIRKVVLHLVPRVDPGAATNLQTLVAACCDNESTAVPAGIAQITAYDNSYSKWLVSGDRFTYTFYPKVTNTVDISGTATAAGSYGMNPWLRLDATGITVPHLSLKIGAEVATGLGAATQSYDYYFDYHIDVKGMN